MQSDLEINQKLKDLIDSYRTITIVSHINPDPDTIGTALGLSLLLKNYGKQVEVVNYSKSIPQYLDFLPNFSKIKHKIDYVESLIVTCDAGSLDLLGFDLQNREIINIDHHVTNEYYGEINLVDTKACCASQVAYEALQWLLPITKESAICFYTALLSDSNNFTTSSVTPEAFDFAMQLIDKGVEHYEISKNLNNRRSLASVRLMAQALEKLELHHNATVASIVIDQEMLLQTGATLNDTVGIADIACSLATVEVAIVLVEEAKRIKVSMRSKNSDISGIAKYFWGGGHKNAAGFSLDVIPLKELLDKILTKLLDLGNIQ